MKHSTTGVAQPAASVAPEPSRKDRCTRLLHPPLAYNATDTNDQHASGTPPISPLTWSNYPYPAIADPSRDNTIEPIAMPKTLS